MFKIRNFKCDVFDFLGGILGAGASVANNERNIQLQRETNALNAALAREQMAQQVSMQRENNKFNHDESLAAFQRSAQYNSESAVMARRIAAGLNPLSGDASSTVVQSSPQSTSSGISPTMTHLDAPHSSLADFSAIAQGIKALADAKKAGVDTKFLQDTLEPRIRAAAAQSESEQWKSVINKVDAAAHSLYQLGVKKKELDILTQKALNENAEYWVKDSQIALNLAQEIKERALAGKYGRESSQIETIISNLQEDFDTLFALRRAQVNSNVASAQASLASAEKSHEEAVTEREFRPERKEQLGYQTDILLDEKEVSNSTVLARINAIEKSDDYKSLVNEELRERIRKAKKDNDYYELRLILGSLPKALVKRFGTYNIRNTMNN